MPTFLEAEHYRAAKNHGCNGCFRSISKGETYSRQRGFDGADAWTCRMCIHCEAVFSIYDPRDMDDLLSFDGLQAWTEDPPRDVAEARAMAGWKHAWRTQSGTLWPLPVAAPKEAPRAV